MTNARAVFSLVLELRELVRRKLQVAMQEVLFPGLLFAHVRSGRTRSLKACCALGQNLSNANFIANFTRRQLQLAALDDHDYC
jgi:hypothetical protein